MVKNLPANAEDTGDSGLIPGSGRCPGRGGQPTPVVLPGKSHNRMGAWWVTVHEITESQTQLSMHTCIL